MTPDLFPQIPSRKKSPPVAKPIVRIKLGEAASHELDQLGFPCYSIIGCERPPGEPRRWILYIMQARHSAAIDALELIRFAVADERGENQTISTP